jgi:zinc protease
LTIFAICNPANIEKVNQAIREEVDKLLAEGPTESELEEAKKGYLQQQHVARTSDGMLAAILADNRYVGRTMAYYADVERKIAELDTDQVTDALQKYIDPQRLVVVDAGDFSSKASAAK